MTATNGCSEGGEAPCYAHLLGPTDDITDRHDIERFVRDFYRQAAMDDLLAPVFEHAGIDWKHHIATLVDFWDWQLFGDRTYVGNPLRAHEPLHERDPFTTAHYDRWLGLFVDTLDGLFAGPMADLAKQRARKMAAAMQRLLEGVSGEGDVPTEPVGPLRVRES